MQTLGTTRTQGDLEKLGLLRAREQRLCRPLDECLPRPAGATVTLHSRWVEGQIFGQVEPEDILRRLLIRAVDLDLAIDPGLAAWAPKSPRPRTAVPLVTTATRLPLAVRS